MPAETIPPTLQLSDAYRRARGFTTILCAIALAWGAAQFEFKSLNFGAAGSVDLSSASVPLILACAIAYAMTRCTIEFAMQPESVRRWRLAQADFKLTVFLVRTAALILGAGGLYRSVETVLAVALVVLILLVASVLLIGAGTLVLTPLMLAIRARRAGHSPGGSPIWAIMEAEGWAALVTVMLQSVLFVALGVGFLLYEPLRSLWTAPPTATAVTVFVLTAIAVVISVYLQPRWYQELFVDEAPFTTKRLPDGTIGVSFRKQPATVPPVQSENSNPQQSSDPHSR